MARNLENLQLGTLIELADEYIGIGMNPANVDLLTGEIERLKGLKESEGKMTSKDESRLIRVAALNVGLAVKLNRPRST